MGITLLISFFSELTWQQKHRAIIFHTVAAESPGRTLLRAPCIPRWDRRDNDDARSEQTGKPGRRKLLRTAMIFHFFEIAKFVSVSAAPQMNSCRLVFAATWHTEQKPQQPQPRRWRPRHLTPHSTSSKSTGGQTRGYRWQCAYWHNSTMSCYLSKLHAWISWAQEEKNRSCPGLLKRTTKQAVAWKKEEKKVTRVVLKTQNKPAEAHARSSAWRQSVFNSPNKCRKCEAVSQMKPRWTEKRLQYDLFREA